MAEARKALQHKARRRRVRRMLEELAVLIERTTQVIAQARIRVEGGQPDGSTRLVSLHEPDARPIRKGRLGKPVEFGYKAQVIDNRAGIIVDGCDEATVRGSDTECVQQSARDMGGRYACWLAFGSHVNAAVQPDIQ